MTIARRIGRLPKPAEELRKEIFERIGAKPHALYSELVRAVEFGEGRDPQHALSYLGEYKYRRAIPLIVRTAWKWDASKALERVNMVGSACFALGMMDAPKAHRELIRLFDESKDLWTRAFAVDAHGWEKRCAEPERVIRILQSDEPMEIRYHAMWAILEQVYYNTFVPYEAAVVAALGDREPCVRAMAVEALGRAWKKEYRNLIVPMLDDTAFCRQQNREVAAAARETLELFNLE